MSPSADRDRRPIRAATPPRTRAELLLVALLLSGCGTGSDSVVIRDVQVVDGTGAPPFLGSVRIVGDRIEQVGDVALLRGESVVDGDGLFLSPGFIDTHSHHDRGLLEEFRTARAAVSQGITTIVIGQDGGSQYPIVDFFARVEATPPSVNVASYTGHNTLRTSVMGDDFLRPATKEEVDSMAVLLRADMAGGSLGLSTGLEYRVGFNSTTDEVVSLAVVAQQFGGRYISHVRSEDRGVFEAIDEAIQIGAAAEIPVQISHLKLAMRSLWGRAYEVVDRLNAARARGVEVTADVYPYTYWQSTMTVLVPDGNFTRQAAEFALSELAAPADIVLGRFSPNPSYEGLTLKEIAELRTEDAVSTYLALVALTHGPDASPDAAESIVARSMAEDDVRHFVAWEHANVSSDGALDGAHPRGYGAFTRVLGRYVRAEGVLSLEDAVHKMTGLSAQHVGLRDRGVIRPGAYADLVLFDSATVLDHAEIANPHRVSTGIEAVWVNGTRVWAGSASALEAYPGRVLRRDSG